MWIVKWRVFEYEEIFYIFQIYVYFAIEACINKLVGA